MGLGFWVWGFWVLGVGFLGFGFWVLGFGFWVLGFITAQGAQHTPFIKGLLAFGLGAWGFPPGS